VKKLCVRICIAGSTVVGLMALGPTIASASSPSPASSCVGQLSQGATPHGFSESQPGFLGSFVSQLARAGGPTYGDVSSRLAGEHGDLFMCIASVPPLG
jgi:hypothetical protein